MAEQQTPSPTRGNRSSRSRSPSALISNQPPQNTTATTFTTPLEAADQNDVRRQSPDGSDSTFDGDTASSTASVSSSILEYRTIQGRTYHSEKHDTQYFTPNDDRQSESLDIVHHYLTLLLDGKLHLAPIKPDVQKVVDIGTGDGIWAIDFGDEHPDAEVIGTDLSAMQPNWVPPNVKFEIDDATQPWTWPEHTLDFVHIRFLNGAIKDWHALFREAYRCCKPGGYVESGEFDPRYYCDDGTADGVDVIETWNSVFEMGAQKLGYSFTVIEDNLQETGISNAGFQDINVVAYKAPVGAWAKDQKLAEIGRFTQLTLENDMEGYTLFLWTNVLGWPKDEYQIFLMSMRKVLRNTANIHIYCKYKYVYGCKPVDRAAS
ncbi:hypothetical protein BFJ68_g17274 [Fusarium oxysporum]|uniref:Secondary metabolism regulator LAE1 n=1 Tax=Fusarium oxysporum TaxID=5507 RepID=A0A420M8H8_FUSOX|nr:hypothetical protein BFJ66_g17465 [Fusarium oxysporum f. sp. cepae]RKK23559.1 hypothetical protein BFJ67_g17105 [Fusarium oxysporum f. sp. cepae]RKK58872.1 hypothetical protein BFJ69_g17362 [Fusarium oxysporum]RKK85278.1 hypothetical protein BFJ68_g17274 [Fusarium oxysporum]